MQAIQSTLKFDQWYGTETAKDHSIGVFRPGEARWYLDNGNGQWEGCGVNGDVCPSFGGVGDRGLTGDWDGSSSPDLGTFRPATGQFFLDKDGDTVWDGPPTDRLPGPFGGPTDLPIRGKWRSTGGVRIGVFRPSIAGWYLDLNDNGVWDDEPTDDFISFGAPNDLPVTGDWNGNGVTKIGVYRPSEGRWYFDYNGNGLWQGCNLDRCFGPFGLSDDLPVIGNWTGTSGDKIGIFHRSGGGIVPPATWVLDNGDGVFTSYQREQKLGPFGVSTDQAVRWRKTVVKAN